MALQPLQFSGRGLTPDVLGGIQQGQQVAQGQNILDQQRAAQQAAQLQAQQQQQASALAKRGAEGEQIQTGAELAQLFVDRPDLAKQVHASAGAITDFQKNDLAQFGFNLEQATTPEQQQQLIEQRVQTLDSQNRNSQDTAALRGADPQKVGQFARTVQLAALSNEERLKIAQGGAKGLASAKTEFLPGGGSIQALPDGKVVIKDEQDNIVEGQDRVSLFKRSKEFQLALAQGKADIGVQADIDKATGTGEAELPIEGKKQVLKLNNARISELNTSAKPRSAAVSKARKFMRAIESGKAFTGAGRSAAQFVPGVFTDQGEFDEEFNAFAEVAARQKLKASGELRPTDADVEGMKRAIFGVGRDEDVNVQLLKEFISDLEDQDDELDELLLSKRSGDLGTFVRDTSSVESPEIKAKKARLAELRAKAAK